MNRRGFLGTLAAAALGAAARLYGTTAPPPALQRGGIVPDGAAVRRLTSLCPYEFGDPFCGYTGPHDECDKTIASCRERFGNAHNFGGLPARDNCLNITRIETFTAGGRIRCGAACYLHDDDLVREKPGAGGRFVGFAVTESRAGGMLLVSSSGTISTGEMIENTKQLLAEFEKFRDGAWMRS